MRKRINTDPQYGGPLPVFDFLSAEQIADREEPIEPGAPAWADRYFLTRPQFSNRGVPDYTSDRGTLPRYSLSRRTPDVDQLSTVDSVITSLGEARETEEPGEVIVEA
jgi:hypothetical protein